MDRPVFSTENLRTLNPSSMPQCSGLSNSVTLTVLPRSNFANAATKLDNRKPLDRETMREIGDSTEIREEPGTG